MNNSYFIENGMTNSETSRVAEFMAISKLLITTLSAESLDS
jgi:hypothetical protein